MKYLFLSFISLFYLSGLSAAPRIISENSIIAYVVDESKNIGFVIDKEDNYERCRDEEPYKPFYEDKITKIVIRGKSYQKNTETYIIYDGGRTRVDWKDSCPDEITVSGERAHLQLPDLCYIMISRSKCGIFLCSNKGCEITEGDGLNFQT